MVTRILLLSSVSLLVLSCGKKDDSSGQASDPIESRFQGKWDHAYSPNSSQPILARRSCTKPVSGGSYDVDGVVGKDSFATTMNRYIGNDECAGETYIKITDTVTVAPVESSDERQIVKGVSGELEVIVKGAAAAAFLNAQNSGSGTCGHTDWAEGTYTQDSANIKDCTTSNEGELSMTVATEEEIKNMRYRFKPFTGYGIERAAKKESEDDTVYTSGTSYWMPAR